MTPARRIDAAPVASRRALLKSGAAAAATWVLGVELWPAAARAGVGSAAGRVFAPDAFIRIDEQGTVTLTMPQVEMGQGVYTSLAMILAEELDADFSRVKLEQPNS